MTMPSRNSAIQPADLGYDFHIVSHQDYSAPTLWFLLFY